MNDKVSDAGGLFISFHCPIPHCGRVTQVAANNARFDRKDKSGSGEGYAETDTRCDRCETAFTVAIRATKEGRQAILKDHPGATVGFVDSSFEDQYDEYLSGYAPENPYEAYTETFMRLKDIQRVLAVNTAIQSTFYKMVYLQHIIALEAYLSDRLIEILADHKELLIALIGATDALRDQTLKLIEVAKDPNYVVNATKKYLQHFSFHDIEKVAKFYKAVLRVDLFKDKEHEQEMLRIIKLRHDLVHRNGRNNEGVDTVIEDEDITILADQMMGIVTHIESAHGAFVVTKWFQSHQW